MKKVSLVITVLNEEESIQILLESIAAQTQRPDEVVIVDGGSSDNTVALIQSFAKKNKKLSIRLLEKKGNISVGRNFGVSNAKYALIASTDAGCRLDTNWLKFLIKKYNSSTSPVVAGYALGDPKSSFEEAMVPYVLVMPDRVNPENYLPATRSMLFEKKVWQDLGGFNETLKVSEDFDFAQRLVSSGVKISFEKKAVVFWRPRSTFISFLKMMYNFAKYDVRAGIYRPKVGLIFIRYLLGFLLTLYLLNKSIVVTSSFLLLTFLVYSLWSINKNKKYVPNAWYYLPLLQIGSDFAVMWGSVAGMFD